MAEWQQFDLPLLTKGLDLVRSIEDIPPEYMGVFTNVSSVIEGSIQSREGYAKLNTSATAKVLGIARMDAQWGGVATRWIKTSAGFYYENPAGTWNGPIATLSTVMPPDFVHWRPRLSQQSWLYMTDGGISAIKSRFDGTQDITRSIGIKDPRYYLNGGHIPAPSIAAATRVTLYTEQSLGGAPTGTDMDNDWVGDNLSADGFGTPVTADASITRWKPTQSYADKPGDLTEAGPPYEGIQKASVKVAGINQVGTMSYICAVTPGTPAAVDLETNVGPEGRVEMFLIISDPAHFEEIALLLNLETPVGVTAWTNAAPSVLTLSSTTGFEVGDEIAVATPNASTGTPHSIQGNYKVTAVTSTTLTIDNTSAPGSAGSSITDLYAVNMSRNFYLIAIKPAEITYVPELPVNIEDEVQKYLDEEAQYLNPDFDTESGLPAWVEDAARQQAIRENRPSQKIEGWTPIYGTLGRGQWTVLSVPKVRFIRFGSDTSKDWSSITAIHLRGKTNENVTTSDYLGLHDIDTIETESLLDSSKGLSYDWRYTYWSEDLGIESNPSSIMPESVEVLGKVATLTLTGTSDPQVSHLRIYRRGGFLFNDWYLVSSIENPGATTTTYADKIDDVSLISSPTLRIDNHIPIPTEAEYTNYLKFSQQFNSAGWTSSNVTVGENEQVAPDQSNTADRLTATAGNAYIYQTVTGLSATTASLRAAEYIFSVYVRRDNKGDSPVQGTIQLGYDTAGGTAFTWSAISPVGNTEGYESGKWERFSLEVGTPAVSSMSVGIRIVTSGDIISVWGAQLERIRMTAVITPNVHPVISPYIFTESTKDTKILTLHDCIPSHIFGPFLGKYIFGIRPRIYDDEVAPYEDSTLKAGHLFWCNPDNPDSWSPLNNLEVTGNSEPLQRGLIYNQRAYVFSTEDLYVIYQDWRSPSTFTVLKTPCGVGLWARYALAQGPAIWFLGKDGIYETTGGTAKNITEDSTIRPLFHGETVRGYAPVDFQNADTTGTITNITQANPGVVTSVGHGLSTGDRIRITSVSGMTEVNDRPYEITVLTTDTFSLTGIDTTGYTAYSTGGLWAEVPYHDVRSDDYFMEWQDPYLWFSYLGTDGNRYVLRYHGYLNRWEFFDYAADITCIKWEEETRSLLMGTDDGFVVREGGTSDAGTAITATFQTGSLDQGSMRAEKYYGEVWVEATIPSGTNVVVTAYTDDGTVADTPSATLAGTSARLWYLVPLRRGNGLRSRDLSLKFTWTSTTASPVIHSASVSVLPRPNLTTTLASDWDNLGVPHDKYIWGCNLDIETIGDVEKVIQIQADGTSYRQLTISRPISTTIQTGATAGSNVSIVLTSMLNIVQGIKIVLDDGGANEEEVEVETIDIATNTITCDTVNNHIASEVVRLGANESVRRNVELSWPVFRATQVRYLSEDFDSWIVHGVQWYFEKEAPLIAEWHTQWENLNPGGDVYVWGIELEVDTQGGNKTVVFERDGGTNISTETLNASGHDKVRFTWDAVRARTLRLRCTDANDGYLYRWKWLASPEPPLVAEWDTNHENDGSLEDKWISGLYLEVDTEGANKDIDIWIDGVLHSESPFTFSSTGKKPVKISFTDPIRGVTMRWAAASTNNNNMRMYRYKWQWEPEPVELTNLATNWEDLGWPYEKYIKGVSVEADTFNVQKELALRINGDETTNVATFTFTHDGRNKVFADFDNVLARTVRLAPTDAVTGRKYNVRWIWDREPVSLDLMQTQETDFNQKGWSHIRDAYICLRSTATVTMRVIYDGVINADYVIPSTGGLRLKQRVELAPRKGKVYKFRFSSTAPFKLYIPECEVRVRQWNSQLDYKPYQLPFEGGEENP